MTRARLCRCGHSWGRHEDNEFLAPCWECTCTDYTPGKPAPRRNNPEAEVRKAVARELHLAGFRRYIVQGRYDPRYGSTGNSAGVPDEYYIHPNGEAFWWEAKAPKGRHRAAQLEFARLHAQATERAVATGRNLPPSVHCWRSSAQCVEWLTHYGYRAVVGGRVVYPAGGAE